MEESLGAKEKKHVPDLHPLLDASHAFLMFFRITVHSNSNLSLPHTFLFGGRHWRAKGRVVSNNSIVVSSHLWILLSKLSSQEPAKGTPFWPWSMLVWLLACPGLSGSDIHVLM